MSTTRASSLVSRPSTVPRPAARPSGVAPARTSKTPPPCSRPRLVSLRSIDLEVDEPATPSVPPPLPTRARAMIPRSPAAVRRESAPPPSQKRQRSVPSSLPAQPSGTRVVGEELLTTLFDRVHALSFVADTLEAADQCLTILTELVPCRSGIVHFFDLAKNDFMIVATSGDGGEDLVLQRHTSEDPVLRAAFSRGRVIACNDLGGSAGAPGGRFAALGGVHRVLLAPIVVGDRYLGAIELIDPSDGQPFDENDENAVGYVAERMASFILAHGVIVDVGIVARFAYGAR